MQRERHNRDESINSRGLFDGPRGFASHRSMMSSILGDRDPFDDPFFNRPFESVFGPSIFDRHGSFDDLPRPSRSSSKGLVIEEIDTDDEGEEGENGASGVKDNQAAGSATSDKGPLIEHPDDEEEVKKDVRYNGNHNKMEGTKPQTQSISYKKVTYGGINGAYYTATTTRKSSSDGVVLEDSKEADKTTGRATHRISKGLNDKSRENLVRMGKWTLCRPYTTLMKMSWLVLNKHGRVMLIGTSLDGMKNSTHLEGQGLAACDHLGWHSSLAMTLIAVAG